MNDQSKLVGSVLIGIAAGVAIGLLLSLIEGDKIVQTLQSLTDDEQPSGPAKKAEDWSDLNDSLGG